jgi:hypothetical protein
VRRPDAEILKAIEPDLAEKWDEQVLRIGETIAMKKPSQHLINAEVPRSITKVGVGFPLPVEN